MLSVRDVATKALEEARNADTVGKSQEARLVVDAPADVLEVLGAREQGALAELFIVSEVALGAESPEIVVRVERASGEKCPRCWNWRQLGPDGLCARCSDVVAALG